MLSKTIKYVDYDGNERTEVFYFNLSEAEMTEMELSETGGLSKMIQNLVSSRDATRIVQIFKEIILKAYGEKSPDGRRFVKSKELSDAFAQTPAYSLLFMELAKDAQAASAFINGVVPQQPATKD